MDFEKEKKDFLKKKDKSKKGDIDKEIAALVELINKKEYFYTTSSCSGRIVLLAKKSEKKQDVEWVFTSHNKIRFNEIKNKLNCLPKQDVWFRYEPLIMHIAANSIEKAQQIVNIARNLGFKRSGIQSTRRKIIVEVASTEVIDTIIAKNGRLLVDDSYIQILAKESNKKLDRTHKKIKKFYDSIKKI